jgi:hypothetical protein
MSLRYSNKPSSYWVGALDFICAIDSKLHPESREIRSSKEILSEKTYLKNEESLMIPVDPAPFK